MFFRHVRIRAPSNKLNMYGGLENFPFILDAVCCNKNVHEHVHVHFMDRLFFVAVVVVDLTISMV